MVYKKAFKKRSPILGRPVDVRFAITQEFGHDNTGHKVRSKFYTLFNNKHPGVDFNTPVGTPVNCSFPGIVVRKGFHKGMGNVVGVRNGNIVALYGHLDNFNVKLGDTVEMQGPLGSSGNTGVAGSTHPHLHFELRDLTEDSLKDMVFKPEFGAEIRKWRKEFTYTVNNQNTKKTMEVLAKMYFGSKNHWKKILSRNKDLKSFARDHLLANGLQVIIPNYID